MTAGSKSFSLIRILGQLVQKPVSIVSDIFELAVLEMQLAGRSLCKIIFLAVFAGIFLTATWLALMVMLYVFLLSLNIGPLLSLLAIVIFNALLTGIFLFQIKKYHQDLTFPATCKQFGASKGSL